MPTYLYECGEHGEFEEYHSISHILTDCPKCKEEGKVPQQLKRLINNISKGIVDLQGQELVDKLKGDAQKLKQEAAKDEKVYANLLGDNHYQALQTRIDQQKREHREGKVRRR